MENNIQTIIDKFDKEFPKVNYDKDATYIPDYEQYPKLKQFLKDSLISMLDGNVEEAKKIQYQNTNDVFEMGFNNGVQEVINIINSHR